MAPMFTLCELLSSGDVHCECHDMKPVVHYHRPMTKHFIREHREAKGWTQQKLADEAGYGKSTISMLEAGNRELSAESHQAIADALGIATFALLLPPADDRHDKALKEDGIPVLGQVAANGESYHLWDYDPGVVVDRLPIMMRGAEMALPIKGESMFPRFKEGEYAILGPILDDPSAWIGEDVVAQIDDGRIVIKILERCPTGRWTLTSVNPMFKRIEDVDLEWVRPVISTLMRPN